ncbi:MAG: GNAT family N-acetyltransferase [Armatimonadota bacterium]
MLLRPLEAADADVLAAMWSDPDVTKYMGGPRDFQRVRQILEDEVRTGSPEPIGFWPVVEKASACVVGHCGLQQKDVDGRTEIELVYVFAGESWGKGYATEAASAVRDYASHSLGLPRIIALIQPENRASARVAEKIGMQFERETHRPSESIMHIYATRARHEGVA